MRTESKEEVEALQELFAMSPEQIQLVPHDKVRWICAGKGCKRSTGVLDFGIHPMYYHKSLKDQAGKKFHWIDPKVNFFMCQRHYKIYKRLNGKYDPAHVARKIFDFNKNFIEKK